MKRCPNCHTENEADNIFCVSCGSNLAPPIQSGVTTEPSPTQYYSAEQLNRAENAPESVQTVFPSANAYQPPPNFDASIPNVESPRARKSGGGKFVLLGALVLLLLIGGGIAAFFAFNRETTIGKETLPDHLGLFLSNKDANNFTEISRQDSTNALTTKDDLLKNESLPATDDRPALILYSDGKDIPLGDLKLVQIDSIKDDGTLKHINFQAAPVEGKAEMKRLRVAEALANGKYAFALFDGFLDEGKHKFWAFQVKNSSKTDNGDLAKTMTLAMKAKSASNANSNSNTTPTATNTAPAVVKTAPTPKPEAVAPVGSRVAYSGSSNVVMRGSPSLTGRKVSGLKRGQKVYVINYSDNYDYWNGMEGNWAYVQTESGSRGWVFSPLINY